MILSHFGFWPCGQITYNLALNGQTKIGIGPNTKILHFAKCQTEQPLLSFSILRVKLGSRVCGWGIFGEKWREFFIDSVDSELESSSYTAYQNSR